MSQTMLATYKNTWYCAASNGSAQNRIWQYTEQNAMSRILGRVRGKQHAIEVIVLRTISMFKCRARYSWNFLSRFVRFHKCTKSFSKLWFIRPCTKSKSTRFTRTHELCDRAHRYARLRRFYPSRDLFCRHYGTHYSDMYTTKLYTCAAAIAPQRSELLE